MVAHAGFFVIFSILVIHSIDLTSATEKEVLVRDRLLFLICDQFDEYMSTGEFPEEIKVMPEKYKKMKPGGATNLKGRQLKGQKGKAMKKKAKGRKAWNSRPKRSYPITILDLQDDSW